MKYACVVVGLVACPLAGCLWADEHTETVTGYAAHALVRGDGHVEGADAAASFGYAGVSIDGEASLHRAQRRGDPDTAPGVRLGGTLRASLFGVLSSDHRLERYLDLGALAGVGGGAVFRPHGTPDEASGWVGAWVDVGGLPLGGGTLALSGSIRAETSSDPWINRTQIAVGLAWRTRQVTGRYLPLRD